LRAGETDPPLADLVAKLAGHVKFDERRVLYNWIGARATTGAVRGTSGL